MAIITLTKVPLPLDRPGQAGEIEVTPQMVEAGARVIEDMFEVLPAWARLAAKRVFNEMLLASGARSEADRA